MRRSLIGVLVSIALLSGCASSSSSMAYENQMREIERAYQAGEITKADYLNLKQNAENAYRQRQATIAASILSDQ